MCTEKLKNNMFLLTSFFLLVSSFSGCSQKEDSISITSPHIPDQYLKTYSKPLYPKTNEMIGRDTANYILKIERINDNYTLNIKAIKRILDVNTTKK